MIDNRLEQVFDISARDSPVTKNPGGKSTYDDRLNHILEAATRLIAQVGYQNASMRAVARESEVSLAGIYHYFDSKEKMLFLIQSRAFNSLLNNLREKLHGISNPVEQLAVMVREHLEYFAANIAALKVCSHELDSLTGEAYQHTRDIRRQYYDETRKIIDRLLDARRGCRSIDRHVATMYLFGALNWLYRWYDPQRDRPPSSIARQFTSQFLHGIGAALPAGCRRVNNRAPSGKERSANEGRRQQETANGTQE